MDCSIETIKTLCCSGISNYLYFSKKHTPINNIIIVTFKYLLFRIVKLQSYSYTRSLIIIFNNYVYSHITFIVIVMIKDHVNVYLLNTFIYMLNETVKLCFFCRRMYLSTSVWQVIHSFSELCNFRKYSVTKERSSIRQRNRLGDVLYFYFIV